MACGGKVIFLSAQYLEYEPQNLQTIINQVAEKINLPKQNWKIRDKYNASLLCNGFEVYISTGLDVGRPLYKTEPSVMLTDTIAEAELNKRRLALQTRKKNEVKERLRREKERKTIFKP